MGASVISARAVASLSAIFDAALPCSRRKTLWILPKGQSAPEEIATARQTWHGVFHVEHSITDPTSLIVLAKGVSRR
jgi:16S rRNA (guanine527-N7)-methyltransferase